MSSPVPLRAPTEDGAVVARPPLGEAGALLAANHRRHCPGPDFLGRLWPDLQAEARRAVLLAARQYLSGRGEPVPPADAPTLLLAGHQPELFHPGVWVKNFALCGLARRHGAVPLNLIVDNDLVKSTALRLPAPPSPAYPLPHRATVPYDIWAGEAPYEERRVADRALFESFGERACAILRGWDYPPLLAPFWEEVRRQAGPADTGPAPLLGECFAGARRWLERAWGCHNLEVPLSSVCATEPFAWFACHLLADVPRFHALYNASVQDYRRRHGIRSRHHPVPDLASEGDWLEAPFWGWRQGQARRGRLFARLLPDRLELRAGADPWPTLPLATGARVPEAVAAWRGLEDQGFKVRSRALTTTLYARLFLADLFLHGIGGGLYDELTDELMRRFYGCDPPLFMVLSATRLLPLPARPARPEDHHRLAHELRDIHYNPQRHLGTLAADPLLRELLTLRQDWVNRQPDDPAGRHERFRMLRHLTEQLRLPLAEQERRVRQELEVCDRDLETNAVLRRRDYSFCLYPESVLRPFCSQFL